MKSTKHRHVIDESGNEVDDTQHFRRLHAVSELALHRRAVDDTQPLPVSHLLHDGRTDASRVLPVRGDRTIVLRRPVAPQPPRLTLRERVSAGFSAAGRDLDQLIRVLSTGWRRLAEENDRRAAALDARLDALAARLHGTSAAADGRQLSEQYAAAGSTAEMAGLVDEVAAEILQRAKAGAAL